MLKSIKNGKKLKAHLSYTLGTKKQGQPKLSRFPRAQFVIEVSPECDGWSIPNISSLVLCGRRSPQHEQHESQVSVPQMNHSSFGISNGDSFSLNGLNGVPRPTGALQSSIRVKAPRESQNLTYQIWHRDICTWIRIYIYDVVYIR